MDAFWICFYEFPEKYLGIKYKVEDSKKLQLWSSLAKSCSWFWCYENYCFISDRPESLSFNGRYRLHKEDGPAIKWVEGWELYYWNGVEVPKTWITDKPSITKETIIAQTNAEKRRVMREILGAAAYYELLGGVIVIDEDTDQQGNTMRLLCTKSKDEIIDKHVQVLEVICPSTGRMYNLYPPNQKSKNCWEAKASTFQMSQSEFKPLIET